ncbi:MAG: PadR family transcriptional regulator [Dehalococcoidia bacterium]
MSLRFALLALLSKEPNSGYGLQRLLRGTLSHLWDARLQQIYAELARAQEDGLVDVQQVDMPNRPAKKIYTLTTAGDDLLDGWLAGRTDVYVPKDALLIKLYCLDRVPREPLLRQLGERLEHFEGEIDRVRARLGQVSRTDPSQFGELLTLEAALVRAEAHVTWCGRVIEILREAPASEQFTPVERTA